MSAHTAENDVPPRVGDVVTVTGTVRTVEALWPEGHYRITVDVADPASARCQCVAPPASGDTTGGA